MRLKRFFIKKQITFTNERIIDDSEVVVCNVNTTTKNSGAKKAIEYAIKQKKKVINIFDK